MGEVFSTMWMVTFLMVNGRMTKQMVMELTIMSMGPSMRGNGSMTFKRDLGKRHGRTAQSTKDNTVRDTSMAMECTFGVTDLRMTANGSGVRSMVRVHTLGQTDESTSASGRRTKCMGKGR